MTLIKAIKNTIHADSYGRNKAGNIVLRKGYFYTNGKTSLDFADNVEDNLKRHGIKAEVIHNGNHWARFNGGATVAKSSHWWVEIKAV